MIEEASGANRIESEEAATTPDAGEGAATEHASTGGKDLWESIKLLPPAEKILGGACLGLVFGWLVTARWSLLFSFDELGGWFSTCAAIGAALTLALLLAKLLDIPWLSRSLHTRLLIGCALIPTLGILIELLKNFWYAVMLTGALAMAYAALRITTRDNVLKR